MSGMAYEAVTIPGRVATLATCSSDRSADTSGSSAREANTMPGTRMSPNGSIRKRYGDSSTSSIGPPHASTGRWWLPDRSPGYAAERRLGMKGDRVEIVVDAGDGSLRYEVTATRAGRRVETSVGRGVVEVTEVTRSGT